MLSQECRKQIQNKRKNLINQLRQSVQSQESQNIKSNFLQQIVNDEISRMTESENYEFDISDDEYLELMLHLEESLEKELKEKEDLIKYQQLEEMEKEEIDAAVTFWIESPVICPSCKQGYLNEENLSFNCQNCSFYIKNSTGISLSDFQKSLENMIQTHRSTNCSAELQFNGNENLRVYCQECGLDETINF
ncbi:rpa-interacting protein rpain [Anaeramoeba ignava]|uniref:Rpa-interacting protein rpain n=1 Tax=Anaeramoeba ignava TaxID=1746090 RepID=A0A9Q0LJJ7_ANAIG|nr:rpa-interacting protein rpain [Anaeramoeba ignava]